MKETSENASSSQPDIPPQALVEFCHWFWRHSKELHGLGGDVVTSREAALRLFQHFSNPILVLSEDEAIRSMRQDRDGTLSLSDATLCKAGLEGWDLSEVGSRRSTISHLKWDRDMLKHVGAYFFFRRAIDERIWKIPEL